MASSTSGATGTANPAPTRGRKRGYDDAEVLAALVGLFWEKGYGATSLIDIMDVSGLSKSSLYNSFGSKEELFARALDLYLLQSSQVLDDALINGTAGLADVRGFLESRWEAVASGVDGRGCLVVNASSELGSTDDQLVDIARRLRALMRTGLTVALERAVALGEIGAADVEPMANFLVLALNGLAAMMRSGAQPAEVRTHIDAAVHFLQPT